MVMETDNVTDVTVEIRKDIRTERRGLRGDVDGLRGDVGELTVEMAGVKGEVSSLKAGLTEVRDELHELAQFVQVGFKAVLGQGDRRFLDHEGRLRRLEAHVGLDPRRR
jgi:chromosome segregation ATPase